MLHHKQTTIAMSSTMWFHE